MQRRNWRNLDRTFLSLSLFVQSFGSEARRSSLLANYPSSRDSPSLQSHRLDPTPQSFTTLPRKRIHRSSTRIKSTCVTLEHSSLTVLPSRSTSLPSLASFRRSAANFRTDSNCVVLVSQCHSNSTFRYTDRRRKDMLYPSVARSHRNRFVDFSRYNHRIPD